MKTIKTIILPIFLIIFSFQLCLPTKAFSISDKEKQREKKLKRLRELQEKKAKLEADLRAKLERTGAPRKTVTEVIVKYEKLFKNCAGKKNERCADIIYTLSKLYYDKARDDYVNARARYEKAMDRYERNPSGPEPINPIPDYSKSLHLYQQSVKEYPDFMKADEGYYQIGTILTIQGDPDGSKDAFKNLVTRFPNSIRASAAHFRLSEFCFLDRDFTCALKHIEKIKREEINPEVQEMAHYRKAEIYYNRADFDQAVELFYTYVDKCDQGMFLKKDLRSEALEYLAISFSDMPNGAQQAIKFFKKVGARPYENYVIYTVGMKNFNHGQYDQAVLALNTSLKKYPYYKDAPIAQQMIVACFIIRKKYDKANKEREKLVDYYGKGSEWYNQNASDAVALEEAGNEVRRALASIPIFYHAEAQRKKSKAMYEKAIKRYRQYIKLFPEEKWKIYEFKYNIAEIYNAVHEYVKAANNYDFVATQDLSTYPKFRLELDTLGMEEEEKERLRKKSNRTSPVSISQEDAGYNAIVALDNLRKKKMRNEGLSDKQAYSLPETKKFIEYIHTFKTKFPKSSNTPEVLYLAGNVHFSSKAYDAAIVEFKNIIVNYSHTKYGNKSLKMLANTYSKSGEYNMALQKYKQLIAREKPNTKGYKDVVDLAAGAMFKNANALKESGNFIGASDAFKAIFAEFPTSKIADKAWFEAATSLEEAKSLELAAATFQQLGNKFPKSTLREKAYVRAAKSYEKLKMWADAARAYELGASKIGKADYAIPSLSAAGENYKKAKLYNKAGQMYENILHKYPTDKRTPLAIYNGGLTFEKGKMYKKAIDMYDILGTKYKESDYAADGYFSIGFCFEKLGKNSDMARAFTSYAEKFTGNKTKQIEALVKAAQAYIKMNKYQEAEKNAVTAVKLYEKFNKKTSIDPVSASKAYYTLGEIHQKKYTKVKLVAKREKDIKIKLKAKTKALEPVLKSYAEAIKLGVGEWTIRSNYNVGKSFVDFAEAFRNQTLFGSRDQKTASKIKIISGLEKYYSKALEKFQWNINTAYEQNITNKWVDVSKDEFMRIAYKKGYLFEEIGLIFKNAPIPRGMPKEDKLAYKDILEEKYLEALDAALPKYEEGVYAAKELGIVESKWLDSLKARIGFINPSSNVLSVVITERAPRPVTAIAGPSTEGGEVEASTISYQGSDDQFRRALQRISQIVAMKSPAAEKVKQLRSIENDAKREIQKEEEMIEEYKEKLGID